MLVASHGVPDKELPVRIAVEEDATVAAVQDPVREAWRQGDTRGGAGSGDEADAPACGERPKVLEEAKHGRCSMECAKAVEESGAANETAPAPADERGDEEEARIRREAEEDLPKDVVRREICRRRRAVGSGHARCPCGRASVRLGQGLIGGINAFFVCKKEDSVSKIGIPVNFLPTQQRVHTQMHVSFCFLFFFFLFSNAKLVYLK